MPSRKKFILDKLRKAMRAIQGDPRYDWTRCSDSICEAASELMKMVVRYIDNEVTETEVKALYKSYVSLHLVSEAKGSNV